MDGFFSDKWWTAIAGSLLVSGLLFLQTGFFLMACPVASLVSYIWIIPLPRLGTNSFLLAISVLQLMDTVV